MVKIMQTSMTIQGRCITPDNVTQINQLILKQPDWHRTRLSKELCQLWNWRNDKGDLKDMSCRSLLLKLYRQGHISLPPQRRTPPHLIKRKISDVPHNTDPISTDFADLQPIAILDARSNESHHKVFNCFLHRYHYLSFNSTVGENMKYIVFDCHNRPLACLLYGAPAWKAKSRDKFIQWHPTVRRQNLNFLTNNTRFLILPWVKVKNLASHLLSRIAKQINNDWMHRYNHPVFMIETFVDRTRFAGTCYKAANWIYVGQTTGRTRQDQHHCIQTSIKDIYLYPLTKDFHSLLNYTPQLNTQPVNATV